MTRERELELAADVFNGALKMMERKGDTYASAEDVLSNFKRTGERLGLTPFQTLFVYMDKHIEALFNAVRRSPERPSCADGELEDKVRDVIVYCILFLCLLDESSEGQHEKRGESTQFHRVAG